MSLGFASISEKIVACGLSSCVRGSVCPGFTCVQALYVFLCLRRCVDEFQFVFCDVVACSVAGA